MAKIRKTQTSRSLSVGILFGTEMIVRELERNPTFIDGELDAGSFACGREDGSVLYFLDVAYFVAYL